MAWADAVYQQIATMAALGGAGIMSQSIALFCFAAFLLFSLGVVFEMLRLAAGARRDRLEAERCRIAIEEHAVEIRALSAAVEQSLARSAVLRLIEDAAPPGAAADCAVCARERQGRRLAKAASAAAPGALLQKKA
jgi:hypothetical protein